MSYLKEKSKQFDCEIVCKVLSLLLVIHIIIALVVITYNISNKKHEKNNDTPTKHTTIEQRTLR